MIENRRTPRVPCRAPVSVEGPRGPMRGVCRDISLGGLFFLGPTLPVGRTCEVTIELSPGTRAVAQAECRFVSDGTGMGLSFARISQEDLGKVERWINQVFR